MLSVLFHETSHAIHPRTPAWGRQFPPVRVSGLVCVPPTSNRRRLSWDESITSKRFNNE